MLTIFTDGASLGNPGPMGIGVVIYRDELRVEELSEYIGTGTNNIAEYIAVIKGLEAAHEMGAIDVHIKSDKSTWYVVISKILNCDREGFGISALDFHVLNRWNKLHNSP